MGNLPTKWLLVSGVCLGLFSGSARAEGEAAPRLLDEPFDYTEVADAFDGEDPFDLNVRVGFERNVASMTVERETVAATTSAGRSRHVTLAESEIATSTLSLGLEAGVYRDVMVYGRIPLVLSEAQTMTLASDAKCGAGICSEHDALLRDVPQTSAAKSHLLLDLDPIFTSATRSGVPHVDLGAAWGVTRQTRGSRLPTWVLTLEARLPVGAVMKPCAADGSCKSGISRGTTRVKMDTRFSYRVRYLEPYLGISHALEWATAASDRFDPGGEIPSYVDATPPSLSEATLGLVVVPWEERGRFQRFAIDVRGSAAYVSSGRDYTPLFDALGTSTSPHLRAGSSSVGPYSAFTGLSQVAAHAKLGLEGALVMQAAQYVRFRLGTSVSYRTAHLLTGADACDGPTNPAATGGGTRAGSCEQNPLYFPVIDAPGQRFRSAGQWDITLSALAIGQF